MGSFFLALPAMKRLFLSFSLLLSLASFLPALADVEGEELAKRQCRSVHLQHGSIPAQSTALYLQATPLKSAPGTYFCAANFNDGYIGFQEIWDGKKVIIFSIWDPGSMTDNEKDVEEKDRTRLLALGENARSGRFGGEGTGGQSFCDYDWKLNQPMRFLVMRKPAPQKGQKIIAGYFFNHQTKKWQLISAWQTHSSPEEFSFASSFVEDFRRNYESTKHVRSAVFGPVFAYSPEKKWIAMNQVAFTADPTPSSKVNCSYQPEYKAFALTTGGETSLGDFSLFTSKPLPKEAQQAPCPEKEIAPVLESFLKNSFSPQASSK